MTLLNLTGGIKPVDISFGLITDQTVPGGVANFARSVTDNELVLHPLNSIAGTFAGQTMTVVHGWVDATGATSSVQATLGWGGAWVGPGLGDALLGKDSNIRYWRLR